MGKNISQQVFEKYLDSRGFSWEEEPFKAEGVSNPDYLVQTGYGEVFCEIKEIQEDKEVDGEMKLLCRIREGLYSGYPGFPISCFYHNSINESDLAFFLRYVKRFKNTLCSLLPNDYLLLSKDHPKTNIQIVKITYPPDRLSFYCNKTISGKYPIPLRSRGFPFREKLQIEQDGTVFERKYLELVSSEEALFKVKRLKGDFKAVLPQPRARSFNDASKVRGCIDEARKRNFKNHKFKKIPRVLIIYDPRQYSPPCTVADIKEGMFGDDTLSIPVTRNDGMDISGLSTVRFYGRNAKMKTPSQNTTFSAVGLLSKISEQRFQVEIVHHPYPRTSLPSGIFTGEHDKQFVVDPLSKRVVEKWPEIAIGS